MATELPPHLREAKRTVNLLGLAVADAEHLLRQARERHRQAMARYDTLLLEHEGQMELPLGDTL